MAKKRYIKVETEVIKAEAHVLSNGVSGTDMPWATKSQTELFDDEINEIQIDEINEKL